MTNLVRLAVLLSLVACSTSKSPSPAAGSGSAAGSAGSGSAGSGSAPAPAAAKELAPCPDEGPQLNERVAALLGVKPDDVSSALCVAGRFPEPAWALSARYWKRTPDDNQLMEREMLVDAAGNVTWSDETDLPPSADDYGGPMARQAVDLDGDGTQELVETYGDSRRGYDIQLLIVLRRVAGAWQHVLDRQFAYDNSGADEPPIVSCEATWSIAEVGGGKRAVVFEPKTKPAKKAAECVMAKETWVSGGADGKLVLQPAPAPKK